MHSVAFFFAICANLVSVISVYRIVNLRTRRNTESLTFALLELLLHSYTFT